MRIMAGTIVAAALLLWGSSSRFRLGGILMSRRLWIALAILLACGLLVVGLAARSLVAGPSMTFLVTIEGRAPSGGDWLAHRYESREACYIERAPKADLRPGLYWLVPQARRRVS